MKTVKGDLLDLALKGEFDVIVHGCNCFHNFGAGIALQILNKFPEAFEADKQSLYGDVNKMGTYTKAKIVRNGKQFQIINAYTQYGCGTDRVRVDYTSLYKVFCEINRDFDGERIGYPKIGAGLAGGDWKLIEDIIRVTLSGQNHT